MGKKSSFCSSVGDCIEVSWDDENTVVFHNSDYDSLTVTPTEFKAFVEGVKAGEFDEFCND